MAAIGRTLLTGVGMGNPINVTFDGNPRWKAGGITPSWATVAAVSGADVTTKEGFVVPIGSKYLRYGQVMCKITTANAQTVTVTGTPTGGTFSYSLTDPTTMNIATVTLAFDAAVATHQAAIDAAIGANKITVSGAGALPGNVHTLTVSGQALYVAFPTAVLTANALTGGTAPTAAFATTAGATSGQFGPFDSAASDGRQTLLQGRCFILNETLLEYSQLGTYVPSPTPTVVGAIEGGRVWKSRVLATNGSASLAAGPTYANLQAAMPGIEFVEN
jgi:hypothetical protein